MLDIRQLKVENRQTLLQLGFDPISLLTKPVCSAHVYGTQFRPDVSTTNSLLLYLFIVKLFYSI